MTISKYLREIECSAVQQPVPPVQISEAEDSDRVGHLVTCTPNCAKSIQTNIVWRMPDRSDMVGQTYYTRRIIQYVHITNLMYCASVGKEKEN